MRFYNIPPAPEVTSATTVLIRLIDGLGFRYRWATEGLTESNLRFQPTPESMTTIELLNHIYHLAWMVHQSLHGIPVIKQPTKTSFTELRMETDELYILINERLKKMSEEELSRQTLQFANRETTFPFWNLINGPIADALTHVGQVITWRRSDGNPVPRVNLLNGTGMK